MNSRNSRTTPSRAPAIPMHRGPQAAAPATPYPTTPFVHAPNAALLIDFDNVTMGIRSDLGNELRNLLGSDIIKGKVAVQRAYADWRRYPQYIVPLAESSIDMIMAPAYGSSKKNATDIRLAVDAMELVFTRPEIGTYILLSGDSDFASHVTKLKEYGKYVIGVGIRESSSDLLVMNCDEYYSYNALAGLVKSNEEETTKRDPWELVVEAVARMKRNGDVMRSDRLKQVMQEIDASFDEKNLGMAKFSRFAQEAAQRGLLRATKLENGQMEVDVAAPPDGAAPAPAAEVAVRSEPERPRDERQREVEGRNRRGRRGGRGRGERGGRPERESANGRAAPAAETHFAPPLEPPTMAATPSAAATPSVQPAHGVSGERLSRDEAFGLLRRAVASLARTAEESVLASDVRASARALLGRDSESLSERNFERILRDAHDANVIDLRRRGDDWEISPAAEAAPIGEQLAPETPSSSQAARSAANAQALRRGMRQRGVGRGRLAELPPELLTVGVVDLSPESPTAAAAPDAEVAMPTADEVEAPRARGRRGKTAGTKRARGKRAASASGTATAEATPRLRRGGARKKAAAEGEG